MVLDLKDPELQKRIDERVKSGAYASAEHVVAAALHLMEQRENAEGFGPGELDALCQVGIDQLDRGESLQAEDVFREIDELREKAKQERGW